MKRNPYAALAAGLALAALFAAAPPAAGEATHKQVFVKKQVHDCQGDDCADQKQERRIVIVDGDGQVRQIEADHTAWIGNEEHQAFAMAHHGKGGFLGVATTELTPELRRHFGVPEDAGVLVAKVVDDSAAASAGVLVGDILTAVGGVSVASVGGLMRAVSELEPGTAVDLELWRDGGRMTLGATLGERRPSAHHAFLMHCGDGDEDCPRIAAMPDIDCGDDSDCRIEIECGEAGCECTLNGEATECETLPGFAAPGE